MIQFTNPEFSVKVGRFEAVVHTSYAEGTLSADYDPTVYATAVGDAKNFVATAGSVAPIYQSCEEYHEAPCKGIVVGFEVTEKWGGEAVGRGTKLDEAMVNFGIAVASQLR